MRVIGTIRKNFSKGVYQVDFLIEGARVAMLSLDTNARSFDVYKLISSDNPIEIIPEMSISLKGFLGLDYEIDILGSKENWIFKRKRWIHFLMGRRWLHCADTTYEVTDASEKYQVYYKDEWVGTVKKVYENIFDMGEYDISFNPEIDLRVFLVIASILIIELEVLAKRGS